MEQREEIFQVLKKWDGWMFIFNEYLLDVASPIYAFFSLVEAIGIK